MFFPCKIGRTSIHIPRRRFFRYNHPSKEKRILGKYKCLKMSEGYTIGLKLKNDRIAYYMHVTESGSMS